MYFVYIVESIGENDNRNNEVLFNLINKHNIPENNIYFDTDSEDVINEMLDEMGEGDVLVLKRVDDLAVSSKELKLVLEKLENKGIILNSEEHKGLNGKKYFSALLAAQDISDFFREKSRVTGYKRALENSRVGRPSKKKELEVALKLYKTGQFTISEIEKLSGVSSSTIYRNLKNSNH